MENAGISELERLLINLYWNQQANKRWKRETTRTFKIKKEVRQGCLLSPTLFNLYNEFMISESLDGVEGIQFNGVNITYFRYANDAILVAYSKKKLQVTLDKLNVICCKYEMAINVKSNGSEQKR